MTGKIISTTDNKIGFSLVELSIVLVILGLLTGGILTGQSLIRAAELRSVTTEFSQYQTAVNTFKDKYFALPGDMYDATDFWGQGTCPGSVTTPSTDSSTCNGNGNGRIAGTSPENYESYRFWQHLANAGLIAGSYTGVTNDTTANAWNTLVGSNVPRSKISNVGFTTRWYPSANDSNTIYFPGPYGNMMWIGVRAPGGAYTNGAAFTPEELWNIDTKTDDGRPAYGKILTTENSVTCHTNSNPDLSEYALSTKSVECSIIALIGN